MLWPILIGTAILLGACAAAAAQDTPRDAIELYFQAHASGNGDFIRRSFTPDARIEFVENGQFKQWTREQFTASRDRAGLVRAPQGNNRPMEEKIRDLLAKTNPQVTAIPLDPPEDTFAPSCGICTDETYVGDWLGRGAIANPRSYSNDGGSTTFRANEAPVDEG